MLTRVSFSVGIACSLAAGLTLFSQGCGSDAATGGTDSDASSDAAVFDAGPAPHSDASTDASTPTYAIAGTVTGLAGTLVIANNGGDAVTLSPADAGSVAFSFKTKMEKGASYNVAVQSQPQSPSQTCTVTAGSGTVGDADVTNVAVVCTTNQFKIAGTIMGLEGNGLVIQNNAGDNVTIDRTDAGSSVVFEFPTAIASGSSYAVTVLTQPGSPTQTCVVTGGEGTVTAGNVSTVAINCTTNTYTVSGTVTGLSGTGLILRNNGGPDLAVNSSAFAFPAQVTSGQPYAVTVHADPTSPWQACTIDASGSGTITNANVTNVSVHCETKSFAVGGIVKGLVGTGLVLHNGSEDLPVSAAGGADVPFTFATKVASGAAYSVTATSPIGPIQDCVVSNPSGTLAGTDVIDVLVTCTTKTFTVGGTVSGLGGGTVVLTNNDADDTSVAAEGPFTFGTPIADGAPYDVKVKTNPAGKICSVASGSGTVAAAAVTNVAVTCVDPPFSSYSSEGRTVNIYKTPPCADLTVHKTFCQDRGQSWWAPKSQADANLLITNAFELDHHHTWIQTYGVSTLGGGINGYSVSVDSSGCVSYSAGGDWAGFRKWGCSFCDSDVANFGSINKSCCWDSDHAYDWFVCEQ